MTQVFISYTRRNDNDNKFANELRTWLQQSGFQTWMDAYNIPSGSNWDNEIDKGLKSSDVILGIMSATSVASENVKDEWMKAKIEGKLQLILIQQCDIPHQFIRIDYIDLTQNSSAAWQKLNSALQKQGKPIPQKTGITGIFGNWFTPRVAAYPPSGQKTKNRGCTPLVVGIVLGVLLVCGAIFLIIQNLPKTTQPIYPQPTAGESNSAKFLSDVFLTIGNTNFNALSQSACRENNNQVMLDVQNLQNWAIQNSLVRMNSGICNQAGNFSVICNFSFTNSYNLQHNLAITVRTSNDLVCGFSY